MHRTLRRLLFAAALAPLAACAGEEVEPFMDFCTEVAMADCTRGATDSELCTVALIEEDCRALARDGAWDAVQCTPPTPVEADNCLNRLVQFGGGTPFEAIAPRGALCPDGFFAY